MKKALVHDWYYVSGGAEKVIHSINNIWNNLDHYALVDFLDEKDRTFILKGKKAKTSFIQKIPTSRIDHRKFLQWFPYAIEQFDLSKYDLVLSSSASIAKGVLTNQNQLHICYCHSPMRYAWDLYHQYLSDSGLNKGLKGIYAKRVLHKIRIWDYISTQRVDYFIANSNYIAKRIYKVYGRSSRVIYPPVDIDNFELVKEKDNFYVCASRMVPYKKIKLIVEAFNEMPEKKLVVIGDGPEFKAIKKIAKENINILGFVNSNILKKYLQKAKGFVFAAEEDFGIIPVEAQACGTPVLAYGKGGALETVKEGVSGSFFYKQKVEDIIEGVKKMDGIVFDPAEVRKSVEKFSKERFEKEYKETVEELYNKWKSNV